MNKTAIPQATILAFLSLASLSVAEDWTTTDGKTYHDVKDAGHNNQEVNITCKEGDVWVQLKDLPSDLQKRYRYDPKLEQEMDAYLIRVDVPPPSSSSEPVAPDSVQIQKYTAQVKQLLANPVMIRNLTSEQLLWLRSNRLTVAGYLSYKLSPAEAADLRTDEIKLIGLMLMTIESRVNPAIDTTKVIWIQDQSKPALEEKKQMKMKRDVWEFVAECKWYLKALYHHQIDGESVDPEVRPILTEAGVDQASIDFLVDKTQAPDH